MDMAPEAEDLFLYHLLKAVHQRCSQYHYRYADGSSNNGDINDESRKGGPFVECNPPGYEKR
jgi:hypothetical protein